MLCPDAVKRISTVRNLLKHNRVRRIKAKQVLGILRSEKMNANEATTESYVWYIRTIIERMKVIYHQLKETEDSIKQVIESMNSKLKAEGEGLTDIEILRSILGIGTVVLATIIAEAWGLIRRWDIKVLQCLGDTAPVTKQSGKTKQIIKRKVVCRKPRRRVSCFRRNILKALFCQQSQI